MVQSALYALPYTINTYFLYYNTSQLEETQVESLSTIIAAAKEANKQAFGFKISANCEMNPFVTKLLISFPGIWKTSGPLDHYRCCKRS